MKKTATLFLFFTLFLLTQVACAQEEDKVYYAIEINDAICGYTESSSSPAQRKGSGYLDQEIHVFVMVSLFGSSFNSETNISSLIDSATGRCHEINGEIKQGDIERKFAIQTERDYAIVTSSIMKEPTRIKLGPEVLFGSDEIYKKLKQDFIVNGLTETSYEILEAIEAEIQNSTFKKTGREIVELNGKSFDALIIEQRNNKTGLTITYWMAPELDYFLMFKVMNRKVYLADRSVIDKIKVADMDESILTKTNVTIADIQGITYMKLRVKIQPAGVKLKPEDLNIPGQKFTGEIRADNFIDGILEIDYPMYYGANAPAFPADHSGDIELDKYLRPASNIESDDSAIIKKAKELTNGSENSWDAVKRLSSWVANEISYAIPGGGSAKGAFETKSGECGAHSMLLAAFCRSVGIPARVVFGGMYTPNMGGSFGQHAWNEVYMGAAGWIPIDATAFEIDFVDAGHIRISEHTSANSAFNAREINVIDYRIGGQKPEELADLEGKYDKYLGKYIEKKSSSVFEVLVKEGNLAVNIPGKAILPMNDQDETGKWLCKLTNKIYVEFAEDEDSNISSMIFHQLVDMPRKDDAVDLEGVPDDIKPYLGNYHFPALNAVFAIGYKDKSLTLFDPTENKTVDLVFSEKKGGWLDEKENKIISFRKDAEGKLIALSIDAATEFIRE